MKYEEMVMIDLGFSLIGLAYCTNLAHISLFNRCSLGFICVWIIYLEALMMCGILLQLGSTAIGVKTKEGVVLAVEKRITSTLLVLFLTLNSLFNLLDSQFLNK